MPKSLADAAIRLTGSTTAPANAAETKVSELSGIPRVSYIRYETGERKPNITQIAAIAQALNIPFSTFVRRIEDRVKSQ